MNTDLIMNYLQLETIQPYKIYIDTSNVILPIVHISMNSLYNNMVEFATNIIKFVIISFNTISFIAKQSIIEIENNMTMSEKILLGLCIYNLLTIIYQNYKLNYEVKNLNYQVEKLEKNLIYIKKAEGMREDWEQTWAEEIRHYYNEHNNKYTELNKQIKKMKKQINQYN
jgi:hypothetical protein